MVVGGGSCDRGEMSKKWTLARTALVANGMVWFGSAAFLLGWALQQTPVVFAGTGGNVVGWLLLMLVGGALAVVGVLENRGIRRRSKRIS